jgi:hypothetical protein
LFDLCSEASDPCEKKVAVEFLKLAVGKKKLAVVDVEKSYFQIHIKNFFFTCKIKVFLQVKSLINH